LELPLQVISAGIKIFLLAITNCPWFTANKLEEAVKSKAYSTFVRSIMEYASVIWSPYTNSNINTLEMVQRKAAHFVFSD